MNPPRVKICGLTNWEDAMAAIDAGADALGFVFYPPSPRAVTPEQAADITRRLPPFVSKVGLFVDSPLDLIRETIRIATLDTVQLHGDETPEFSDALTREITTIKAVRVRDARSLDSLSKYSTHGWLLDSFVDGVPGGTGKSFNWSIAMEAGLLGRPVILSGGLTSDNVFEAVRKVRPFAVDVSSGVESKPGRKDRNRMIAFVRNARRAAGV